MVVRMGDTRYDVVSNKKWSTPEVAYFLNNQTIRNLFMEYNTIIVLFVSTGDIPVCMGRIENVRQRLDTLDSDYPDASFSGPYETFLTFVEGSMLNLTETAQTIFTNVIASIKFTQGHQILIDSRLSRVIMLFYNSRIIANLEATNTAYGYPTLNTTFYNNIGQ